MTAIERLIEYVVTHTEISNVATNLSVDLTFFHVGIFPDADQHELLQLINDTNKKGEFIDVDLFDGKEHGFVEVGGWIGDQRVALELMALGKMLNLWELLTPAMLTSLPPDIQLQMAEMGMISMISTKKPKNETLH